MRLFQLLAAVPTALSSSSLSSSTSLAAASSPSASILPAEKTPTEQTTSVTVPFFSVGGFVECPWYRRALCIADEFVKTQVEQAQHSIDSDTTHSTADSQLLTPPSPPPPPQHTRVQSVTLPRQLYRHYLMSLQKHIDLHDHYSCPIILQGTCTLTGTPDQHAADYPLQHGGSGGSGEVTGSAVGCECKAEQLVGGYGDFERLLKEQYGFVAKRCGRLAPGSPDGRC